MNFAKYRKSNWFLKQNDDTELFTDFILISHELITAWYKKLMLLYKNLVKNQTEDTTSVFIICRITTMDVEFKIQK